MNGRRILALAALLSGMGALTPSFADTCTELMDFEKEINATLPRRVDEVTELVQVKVNCETRTVSYTKRLLIETGDLAAGWQERKQHQYVQLHCNAQGLASVTQWNAMDVFFDPNYRYVITLRATPQDCVR